MPQRVIDRRQMLLALAAGSSSVLMGQFGCGPSKKIDSGYDGYLTGLDLSEALSAVKARKVSPVELTKACIQRIDRLDEKLNTFITLTIAGLASISIPCGSSTTGLPIGCLISGPIYSEGRLLKIASAYEKAAGWEKRRPPI